MDITAREIVKDIYLEKDLCFHDTQNLKKYISKIKKYARAKCKEQRKLCADVAKIDMVNSTTGYARIDYDGIEDAPKPKFE